MVCWETPYLTPTFKESNGFSWKVWQDTKQKLQRSLLQNMSSNCSLCFFSYFRYREAGVSEWSTIPVTPPGSTQVTINRLSSGTTYEFQVVGKNEIGDGMLSKVITVRTLGEWHVNNIASFLSDINHVNHIFNVYIWLSILNGSAIHSDLTLRMVQFICSDSDFCTSVAVKNFLFCTS